MDRAGLVGADGATHCGAFDVAYMACLPNMVVMAPSNEAELINMVATCAAIDDRPSCFRFPRGSGMGIDLAAEGITPDLKGTPLPVRPLACCRCQAPGGLRFAVLWGWQGCCWRRLGAGTGAALRRGLPTPCALHLPLSCRLARCVCGAAAQTWR